jgi:sulfite exporter TauE/SafE
MSDLKRSAKKTMSLNEAVEIKKREAKLHRSALQKFARIAPFIFIGFFVVAPVLSLATSNRHLIVQDVRDALFLLIVAFAVLAYLHSRSRKRIEMLELEILKIKRQLSSKTE